MSANITPRLRQLDREEALTLKAHAVETRRKKRWNSKERVVLASAGQPETNLGQGTKKAVHGSRDPSSLVVGRLKIWAVKTPEGLIRHKEIAQPRVSGS